MPPTATISPSTAARLYPGAVDATPMTTLDAYPIALRFRRAPPSLPSIALSLGLTRGAKLRERSGGRFGSPYEVAVAALAASPSRRRTCGATRQPTITTSAV